MGSIYAKTDPEYLTSGLMIKINEKLYSRMEELGFAQRDLAKKINKSQPYIFKLLNYSNNMTLKTLVTITSCHKKKNEPPDITLAAL